MKPLRRILLRIRRLFQASVNVFSVGTLGRPAIELFASLIGLAQHLFGRFFLRATSVPLELLQVDALGLDDLDRGYLRTLIKTYDGGPAGIEALAAAMGQERDTLEDVLEPYLLQIGFVIRTVPSASIICLTCWAGLAPKGNERTPLMRQHPTPSSK